MLFLAVCLVFVPSRGGNGRPSSAGGTTGGTLDTPAYELVLADEAPGGVGNDNSWTSNKSADAGAGGCLSRGLLHARQSVRAGLFSSVHSEQAHC